jgi:hypothetical protein
MASYRGSVGHVAPNFDLEFALEVVRKAAECVPLRTAKVIMQRIFCGCKMAEYRGHPYSRELCQGLSDSPAFVGFKTEAMHAAVYLNVYQNVAQCLGVSAVGFGKSRQAFPAKKFGLQAVAKHQFKRGISGIQNHYGAANSRFTQFAPLFGVGNTQIMHPMAF